MSNAPNRSRPSPGSWRPGPRPPRVPARLLRWLLRAKGLEEFAGELEELYAQRARRTGSLRAALWYWRQLSGLLLRWCALGRARGPEREGPGQGRAGLDLSRPVDQLFMDLRFAIRTLRKRPLFALAAILTLGLGIGATTTVYGVANAVLLRTLPFPDADGLVSIWTSRLNDRGEWVTQSLYHSEYRELKARASTLEDVALYYYAGGSLQGRGDPMNLMVGEGTETLPDVVGIPPMLGRWFRPEEVGPERVDVAVLGESLWRDRFGADPDVVGATVLLEHRPYTVIGVMPGAFRLRNALFSDDQGLLSPRETGERPVWLPTGHNYGSTWYHGRTGFSFEAIARLRPGVSLETARAEIESLVRMDTPPEEIRVHLDRRNRLEVAGLPSQLLLLAVPSVLLLLIACGNVATLHLGESEGRRSEMATRAAVGAGRGRIVRQLLTESVLLGIGGSLAGLAVAAGSTRVLAALAPATSPLESIHLNLSVLGFASVAGILAGIGFGLAPALGLGPGKGDSLRAFGHRAPRRSRRGASVVMGMEVALTVVLLAVGGLFGRTLLNLITEDVGFDPEGLVALRAAIDVGLPADERSAAYSEMLREMEKVPGVEAATGSWAMPLLMSLWRDEVATESQEMREDVPLPIRSYDLVMPDYHQVMGIPLLAGRHFTEADGPGAPRVVIVSASVAEAMWPGASPLGKRIRFRRVPEPHTVVGMVGDVKYGGLGAEPQSPIYRPFLQNPGVNGMRLVLTARVVGDPGGMIPRLQAAARTALPEVLLREGSVLSSAVSATATDQRYRALLVMAFALAAVALAAVGLFGVVARGVAQRGREMAIRLALGAESGGLRVLVFGGTLLTGAVGLAAGLVSAWWAGRLIEGYLFGVGAFDAWTYGLTILTVLTVCGVAAYLPTSRVLLLQPATVLKEE